MSIRISVARYLIHFGKFLQSLPVVIMKPDDLIEFSRQTYAQPSDVESWAEAGFVDSGLQQDEQQLADDLPVKQGQLLLLGVGGGREAIPLSKMGFQVTGVDFIEASVEQAKINALRHGENINGLVQEISRLNVPPDTYDVVWLSRALYSSVPTRKRRLALLGTISQSLKSSGRLVCQYHQDPSLNWSKKAVFIRRLVAALTCGNRDYEPGDLLWFDIEFIHAFSSADQVKSELEAAGFEALKFYSDRIPSRVGVICRKKCY